MNKSGSGCWEGAFSVHGLQFSLVLVIAEERPGQYIAVFARALMFVIP